MNKHEAPSALESGLIIAYFGNSVEVEAADGRLLQCQLRRNQALPVVGDQVLWQATAPGAARIEKILARRSLLARGDRGGQQKPLAANLDQLVIIMAPPPVFSTYLIDRYLTAATLLKLEALLVVNKEDLLDEPGREHLQHMLKPYQEIGYATAVCSLKQHVHMQELTTLLAHKTSAFVGPSGVGKSSLISYFVNQDIRTSAVSDKGAGKHTTTGTRLYHIPNGGCLIDSPGVRDFNLWPYSIKELQHGFREFLPYLKNCKFRDCRHIAEPGCNLLEAASNGAINPIRFQNYLELLKGAAR